MVVQFYPSVRYFSMLWAGQSEFVGEWALGFKKASGHGTGGRSKGLGLCFEKLVNIRDEARYSKAGRDAGVPTRISNI